MVETLIKDTQVQKAYVKELIAQVSSLNGGLQNEITKTREEFAAKKIDRNQAIDRLRAYMALAIGVHTNIANAVSKSFSAKKTVWEGTRNYNATDCVDYQENVATVTPELMLQANMVMLTISQFTPMYIDEIRLHLKEIQKGNLK